MLIHYTKNINNVKSILNSGEIWLKRLGQTSDTQEVNHFMNEFNRYHYLVELNMILEKFLSSSTFISLSIKDIVIQITNNKVHWQEGITYGAVLSEILRRNSFLVCFTENEKSEFHTEEYGDFSFEFEDNPLITSNIETHYFLVEKVIYFDSKEIYNLQNVMDRFEVENNKGIEEALQISEEKTVNFVNDIAKLNETMSTKQFLIKWKGETVFLLNKFNKSVSENILRWRKKLTFITEKNFQVDSAVGFITRLMIEKRAEKKTTFLNKDIYFKQNLIRMAMKEINFNEQTKLNLMSYFLKDKKFKRDDETRIVAIPRNNDAIYDSEWLRVPFDIKKLTRIKVSSTLDGRDEKINELKTLLEELGYKEITVE